MLNWYSYNLRCQILDPTLSHQLKTFEIKLLHFLLTFLIENFKDTISTNDKL
jgi:hypothetical protein